MVGGTWALGEWGIRLFAGSEFDTTRWVLVSLALLAAFYLLAETLSQALFALGHARLAALGWLVGLPVAAACMALPVAGFSSASPSPSPSAPSPRPSRRPRST